MTKQQLIDAGLTEAQADAVLKIHKDTLDGSFVAKHRFDEVNTELKATKDQVKERDEQLKDLKKLEGDAQAFQTKIAELETANAEKDKTYNETLATERKKTAIKLQLLSDETGKPHDVDMVLGLFDLSKITVDEATGALTGGYKEQRESLAKEKAFLFAQKEQQSTGGQPGGHWKPIGTEPKDGGQGAGSDTASSFGKGLAQMKLGMMGVNKQSTETK